MASFEAVVEEYDAGRPGYPAAVYDALGSLRGLRVVDGGAGTGIATRELVARGAEVVAVDPGFAVLSRAAARSPGLPAMVADGARLPLSDSSVDLLCFAQAWHWLDPDERCPEAHRVLRSGGRWAAWWSHARGDDESWFDEYWTVLERACPGTHRGQRDTDWGSGVVDSGLFDVAEPITVPWTRTVSVDGWMTDQASHSYIAALPRDRALEVLTELRQVLDGVNSEGSLSIRYDTRLWMASPR